MLTENPRLMSDEKRFLTTIGGDPFQNLEVQVAVYHRVNYLRYYALYAVYTALGVQNLGCNKII